jgi:uncharacterized RDD family membrane protein YckC
LPGSFRRTIVNADPLDEILTRRVVAYLIDLLIIGIIGFAVSIPLSIVTILSFGLLGFLWHLVPLIGVLYTIALIAAPGGATLGMRLTGIRAISAGGAAPGLARAALFTLGFYLSVGFTAGLVLLLPLITPAHRALHDYLSGLVFVRSDRPIFF